jgi:hypothetical protein
VSSAVCSNSRAFQRTGHVVKADAAQRVATAELRRLVGDLLRLVADPLELVDDLRDHQDETQVDRRRLPPGDDLAAELVEVDLHLIDGLLVGADLVDGILALVVVQDGDRAAQLGFDDATHRQDPAPDRLDLGIELLVRVFAHRAIPCQTQAPILPTGISRFSRSVR